MKDAKVCVRVAGAGRRKTVETVTTWDSMTSQILALVTIWPPSGSPVAVMEATSDYWKPFYYYLLEDAGFEVLPGHHLKGRDVRRRHGAQNGAGALPMT